MKKMNYHLEAFEDRIREEKSSSKRENKYSKYCDFIYYQSTIHPELTLAMRVLKPQKPSYIIATTHGWHMSVGAYCEYDLPVSEYLRVEVDMRGRAFSDGKACFDDDSTSGRNDSCRISFYKRIFRDNE